MVCSRSIGCGEKWMEVNVFSNSLSVLVNESHADDFSIKHGLRQGEQITTFMFVWAAEGLACLINKFTT